IALLYAIAMGVDAIIAFPIGYLYDKTKFKSLYITPITTLTITLLLREVFNFVKPPTTLYLALIMLLKTGFTRGYGYCLKRSVNLLH
ncbi:MAG: hypothetical protein QXN35_03025, partial [Ignisphaera sp.]